MLMDQHVKVLCVDVNVNALNSMIGINYVRFRKQKQHLYVSKSVCVFINVWRTDVEYNS